MDIDTGTRRIRTRKLTHATRTVLAVFSVLLLASTAVWSQTINPGDILVVDPNSFGGVGAVFRVDPITGIQTVISSGGFFQEPVAIGIEADGNIVVTDRTGMVIRVNPETGDQTVLSAGGF